MTTDMEQHYASGYEAQRLQQGAGRLEWLRTMEIIRRLLPPSPAMIIDIGGGAGAYAFPLAEKGYTWDLVGPVPEHIHLAQVAIKDDRVSGVTATVGDARAVEADDASADFALLLGPLYHLTEKADRTKAIAEVMRVLRPGGHVVTAGISRFASTCDGIRQNYLTDPAFERIVERDLVEGQHRNESDNHGWFTTAHFHRPEELLGEVKGGGFVETKLVAVEGPAWLLSELDNWFQTESKTETLLRAIRRIEAEPTLWGASAHLIVTGKKPG
jgi:ubiquinone/menaquinone biosynthesis C-methylase UbiE